MMRCTHARPSTATAILWVFLCTGRTACEPGQMPKTEASVFFIIFRYAACVMRPSSCYAASMFLTAPHQRSQHAERASYFIPPRQLPWAERADNLAECWMISLEHPDKGLSQLKSHAFNLALLIKADTCCILTSINLYHLQFELLG